MDYYHNMASVIDAGPVARTNQLDYDDEVVYKARQYLFDHVRFRNGQPFSLTISMTHPHDPYNMTKDYWDLYEDVDIPLPETAAIDHEQQDPHSKRILKCIDLWGKEMTESDILKARRAYFSSCTYVDTKVGEIMKVLKETGLDENTIIVFSGDHGDMLGERGLWYKMSWFEPSARVPMFVYAPGRYQPQRIKENVSTMDLLPTFVDMIGSSLDSGLPMDGVSLMPYISGAQGPKTDTVLGEYMGEGTQAPLVMIRRGPWKFVYSPIDPPQLYNLENDPLEHINLAAGYAATLPSRAEILKNDPSTFINGLPPTPPNGPTFSFNPSALVFPGTDQDAKKDLPSIINAFLQEAAARWDFDAITKNVLESQRRRRLVYSGLIKGVITPWDYTPPADGSKQYVRNQGKGILDDVEFLSRWPRVQRA